MECISYEICHGDALTAVGYQLGDLYYTCDLKCGAVGILGLHDPVAADADCGLSLRFASATANGA
jgi:hypothetical protein